MATDSREETDETDSVKMWVCRLGVCGTSAFEGRREAEAGGGGGRISTRAERRSSSSPPLLL